MTLKQKTFADAVLAGRTNSDAYRLAYDTNAKPTVVAVNAHKVLNHPEVAAYIAAEKAKLAEEDLLSRKEAIAILAKIAKGKDRLSGRTATHRDRIAAVTQASKMLGYDAPTKVAMKVEGSLLHRIRSGSSAQ